ncbi:galactose-1-phosphate uridylyltransferase [Planctomycetales bacterium]|nr:galactose-1-phosphate uridylyltransferase [Planctomycetales bacterium]
MPEYRYDPLTRRTVIVAEERLNRPRQFDIEGKSEEAVCPFCPGNENLTPAEKDTIRSSDFSGNAVSGGNSWLVRAVSNMYPAVSGDSGEHEVIIDTPRHVLSITDLSETEVADMLRMYQRRIAFFRQQNRWAFVQIFKNVGAAAGASLPHSHSQLVALPFVPMYREQIIRSAAEYQSQSRQCFWCDLLQSELRHGERIIEATPRFVALCPIASRFAGEIEIYPKKHQAGFDAISDEQVLDLAKLLRRTVQKLQNVVVWMKNDLAYNLVLNTEPLRCSANPDSTNLDSVNLTQSFANLPDSQHWSLLILPSLARAAGFEWGTGLHINPISPETAAKRLRM